MKRELEDCIIPLAFTFDGVETAIISKHDDWKKRDWYILNGDFFDEYAHCENLEKCLKVFEENIEHKSMSSIY